jgi:hypothetical protein
MSTATSDPSFAAALGWLVKHAGFPTRKLPPEAVGMVCAAALAAAEEAAEQERYLIQRRDPAQTSALKTLGLRRSQVHFKCDNSAKV